MPTITGTLKTFGLDALPPGQHPRLVWVASRLAVTPAGEVLTPEPIPVDLSQDGSWTVTLASTEGLPADCFYRLDALWLSATGVPVAATLRERVYVPVDGGDVADLTTGGVSEMYVYTGPVEPSGPRPAYWLVTGDPAALEPGVRLGDLYKLT